MDKINVLLLCTDQQRADTIGALGNRTIETPNLDRIVREGVTFTSAYTPSPVCVPARCSMKYGEYPARTRCYENDCAMPSDGRPSIMDVLAANGYVTHGIGKCHFTPDAYALRGFHAREMQEEGKRSGGQAYYDFLEQNGLGWIQAPNGLRNEMYYVPQRSPLADHAHPTRWIGDRSVDFIERSARGEAPWFLFSSFIHPHPPFTPPQDRLDRYPALTMPPPNVPEHSESLMTWVNRKQNRYKYRDQGIDRNLVKLIKAYYYACISFVDEQVGRILYSLEKTGQLDRTLVLFCSDHGEHLGDYNCFGKRSMHDSSARVPLLARLPGRFKGGARCELPASLVDLAPTILGAVGCGDGGMRPGGIDLAKLLSGAEKRDTVFAQHHRGGLGSYMAVDREWKYFYSAPDNREFLFDRPGDPLETRNLAGQSGMRDVLAAMRGKLIEHLRECGEEQALAGERWREYPVQTIPAELDIDPVTGRLAQLLPIITNQGSGRKS